MTFPSRCMPAWLHPRQKLKKSDDTLQGEKRLRHPAGIGRSEKTSGTMDGHKLKNHNLGRHTGRCTGVRTPNSPGDSRCLGVWLRHRLELTDTGGWE